jgi:hypothetical protein
MRQLIIKYAILVIVSMVVAKLISAIIMIQFPMLLTTINPDGSTTTFPITFIEMALECVMNIVIVILMKKDLDKENIKSLPMLILTFFSGFVGVLFFLLVTFQNKMTLKKQTT